MPCIEDWLSDPLSVIKRIFEESGKPSPDQVCEYFTNRLRDESSVRLVPSINDIPLHNLKPNSLVRYRCMIQDMFDPEYYLATYEVVDPAAKSTSLNCGMYRDIGQCPVGHQINPESPNSVTRERQTFYCVPIPGENDWTKKMFSAKTINRNQPSNSRANSGNKRGLEDDNMSGHLDPHNASSPDNVGSEIKRSKAEAISNDGSVAVINQDLNFPLPGEKGPACLIKIYSKSETFKVNDMVEFFGVLSVNPSLAMFHDQAMEQEDCFPNPSEFLSREEHEVHNPPPSLVPRIHCILGQRMDHSNPTIPTQCTTDVCKAIMPQVAGVREELLVALTKLLHGDSISAEFLLLHLMSSVYTRAGVMAVGKFTLNVSGCPPHQSGSFTQNLYQFLEELVPKSYLLSMSLNNMNSLQFTPKKDYTANRLKSALLQLSNGTHLVVDETAMEAGQLNETGVSNVAALGNVISWHKLEYDFNFYRTEFQTDMAVLILSEGKSLLPSDCNVVMNCQAAVIPAAEVINSIPHEKLQQMRAYLGIARSSNYQYFLSDEIQEVLQNDFVQSRQHVHSTMTAEDFHLLLLLARLMSLSLGEESLTFEIWKKVKQMEAVRRSRLPATQTPRN